MMRNFGTDLAYSLGERQRVDCCMLQSAIPNCVSVEKTSTEMDKSGIDYIATLDGGATINIDAKARRKGAVKPGEEAPLALEIWSVCPQNGNKGKPGWTWSCTTNVDMILYTFDPSEWDKFYLVPFQHLRMAFQHNYRNWRTKWAPREQNNGAWHSKAMFVPASIVIDAIAQEMLHTWGDTN